MELFGGAKCTLQTHQLSNWRTKRTGPSKHTSSTLQQDQINATNTTSLPLAGRLKFHLVSECTIVVESVLQMPPLDEGTLLVIQIPNIIIPLRKIFEVFGPVARPLYTLRIPPPPSNTTTMKKLNTTITVTATDAVAEEYQNQKKSTELDPPD